MANEKENEKKGLFAGLFGNKKSKKDSCCCNLVLEEVPEEKIKGNGDHASKAKGSESCCK